MIRSRFQVGSQVPTTKYEELAAMRAALLTFGLDTRRSTIGQAPYEHLRAVRHTSACLAVFNPEVACCACILRVAIPRHDEGR